MTQSAPKRYAHSLIRHFVLIALFFPAFYSRFNHIYYQDVFFAGVLALLFAVNIFCKWRLDLRTHRYLVIPVSVLLLLYNLVAFYQYRANSGTYFRKSYQLNITIAFLFFLALVCVRDKDKIITDIVIRLTIYAFNVHAVLGWHYRINGGSIFHMMNLRYAKTPVNHANEFFAWMYTDASEYALLLLLGMALYMVHKDLFRNIWTYAASQLVLLISLYLTKSTTFYLAAIILFGGELIQFLCQRFRVKEKYIRISLAPACALGAVTACILFKFVDSFHMKYLIWKGNWAKIMENPLGMGGSFGVLTYEVPNVDMPLNQAHNVFLNHMLRYSLPLGILYALLFLSIILYSLWRRPNYRTLCIWVALLIPLNMDYALQTLNLPLVLFLLYCIFIHENKQPN